MFVIIVRFVRNFEFLCFLFLSFVVFLVFGGDKVCDLLEDFVKYGFNYFGKDFVILGIIG